MKKKILVIDSYRENWFRKNISNAKICKKFVEAINSLKNSEYDIIFIDCQLGSCKECLNGLDIVKAMKIQGWQKKSLLIIHCQDKEKAQKIIEELGDQYANFLCPFGSDSFIKYCKTIK